MTKLGKDEGLKKVASERKKKKPLLFLAISVGDTAVRFDAGRPIIVDFSPVTDFREATCRQYEENTCNRGGYCNFMHLKKISRDLRRKLFGRHRRRSRSRSRSPRSNHERRERPFDGYHGGRGGRHGGNEFKHDRDDRRFHGRDDERGRNPLGSRQSPGHRKRSPIREGSAERRAKIEQWNREREELQRVNHENNNSY
ncbi:hypothetical protein KP509_17G002300 [Ceratopteris richardii]|uniref:C3H1-type domain-containing protein n=1 Tax=Ceratopteris richardii TaxID=49495 RepID=A0A8T2SVE0_CERRI|nr:hypothetical protein KP509_17G002300 [Ceratopteris richardii]